jgi:hypothetical protein
MMSALRLKRGFEKSMIELCWRNRLPKILELTQRLTIWVHTRLGRLSSEVEKLRPGHPLLPVGIREIAFFETVEEGKGAFEVLGLSELLGLGILDAGPH